MSDKELTTEELRATLEAAKLAKEMGIPTCDHEYPEVMQRTNIPNPHFPGWPIYTCPKCGRRTPTEDDIEEQRRAEKRLVQPTWQ